MIKDFIGSRIKTCRTTRGYSQEKFAQICGLDRTYIASVEAGKRNISVENLEKIANALDVSLSELFSDSSFSKLVITVKNNNFILQSNKQFNSSDIDEIDTICSYVYDEDSSILDVVAEGKTIDDINVMTDYEIIELIKIKIEKVLDARITFVPICAEFNVK